MVLFQMFFLLYIHHYLYYNMISLYIYNIFLGLDMAIFLLNYIYFYFIFFTLLGSDDVIVHDDDGVWVWFGFDFLLYWFTSLLYDGYDGVYLLVSTRVLVLNWMIV